MATGHELGGRQLQWVMFAGSFLGMNIVHNAFSLAFFGLPEFQAWVREQSRARGRNIVFGWIAVAAGLLLFFQSPFFLSIFAVSPASQPGWTVGVARILSIGVMALVFGHALYQQFGFSVLYNIKLREVVVMSPVELERMRRIESWERPLFKLFANFSAFYFGLTSLLPNFPGRLYAVGPIVVLSVVLSLFPFFYPHHGRSNKRFFQLRLLLVLLSAFNPVAMISSAFIHGFEYFFLYRQVARRSAATDKRVFIFLSVVVSAIVILLGIPRPFSGYPDFGKLVTFISDEAINVIVRVSVAISFFHYFLDSRFFRFSDPLTRKYIKPLL